jgi:hypothetical protein
MEAYPDVMEDSKTKLFMLLGKLKQLGQAGVDVFLFYC